MSVLKDAHHQVSTVLVELTAITTKKGNPKSQLTLHSSSHFKFSKMSGKLDATLQDQFADAGGDDKGSRLHN
jgi:iron complex outermembrane receptor protein